MTYARTIRRTLIDLLLVIAVNSPLPATDRPMPMLMSPPTDRALTLLRDLHARDPRAVSHLIDSRVPCNADLASHPTVQVAGPADAARVGLMGVINGLLATLDGGMVTSVYNDETGRLTGFARWPPHPVEPVA